MKTKTTSLILLCAFGFSHLLSAQNFFTLRLDGKGTGNHFLDMSETTRGKIMDGSFDGSIEYLPGRGPVQLGIVDSSIFEPGDYVLELFDNFQADSILSGNIYWRLTKLSTGESAISSFSVHDSPEQLAEAFGIKVSVFDVPAPGEMPPNSGSLGAEIMYADPNGPHWLSGIPDDFHDVHLDFIEDSPQNNAFTSSAGIFFVPFQICRFQNTEANYSEYLTPAWQSPNSPLVFNSNEDVYLQLNNVDLIFTPDTSLWSRCVVVETASFVYSDFFSLVTQNLNNTVCSEIKQFDLRGAPSVGKKDEDNDGKADPDGDGYGMGWFPGYAIDVETGQRLNVFFGENSVYSNSQQAYLLEEYGIEPTDFEQAPTSADMMWNPTGQASVEVDFSAFYPYQFYLGGQHLVYVTKEPYDGCEYLRSRLYCDESLKKVNALKKITWTSIPMPAPGSSLLPISEGLIPNEAIVKLRVQHSFEREIGTNLYAGYPTYRFNMSPVSAAKEAVSPTPSIAVFPNPYPLQSSSPIWIFDVPSGSELSLFDMKGSLVGNLHIGESLNQSNHKTLDISKLISHNLAGGMYVLQIKHKNFGVKYGRITLF